MRANAAVGVGFRYDRVIRIRPPPSSHRRPRAMSAGLHAHSWSRAAVAVSDTASAEPSLELPPVTAMDRRKDLVSAENRVHVDRYGRA